MVTKKTKGVQGGDNTLQGPARRVRDAVDMADRATGRKPQRVKGRAKLTKGKVPLRESGTSMRELRLEYVTNPHATHGSLAEKYGVALNTISKQATLDGWRAERAEYWDRVAEEAKEAGIARWRQVASKTADRLEARLDEIASVSSLLIQRLKEEAKRPDDPEDMRRLEDRVVEIEKVPGETRRNPKTGQMESARHPRTIRKTVRRARALVDPRKLAVILKTEVDLLRAALLRDDDGGGAPTADVFHIE